MLMQLCLLSQRGPGLAFLVWSEAQLSGTAAKIESSEMMTEAGKGQKQMAAGDGDRLQKSHFKTQSQGETTAQW
jgi:hypothetical protein